MNIERGKVYTKYGYSQFAKLEGRVNKAIYIHSACLVLACFLYLL